MKQPDLLERYITALRHDPTSSPPPGLDPAVARAIRAMLLDAPLETPPAGARARVWQRVLAHAQSDHPNLAHRDASRDPRPGSMIVHPNGNNEEKHLMQSAITRSTLPRAPARALQFRFAGLAAAVITVVVVAAILLPGLLRDGTSNGTASVYISPEAANKAVFERYINETWNNGNTGVLPDILTPDHVCHEPGMPDIEGIDGMAAMIANYRAAFPDWQFAIESLTATETDVWARLTGTGTHDGPFTLSDGTVLEATGRAVTVEVVLNARFTDGKITEQWMQSDALGLLLQTETLPAPQQAISEAQNLATARLALEGFYQGADSSIGVQTHHEVFLWQYGDRAEPVSVRSGSSTNYPFRIHNGFTDLEMTIDFIAAKDDIVMAQTTFTGQFVNSIPEIWSGTTVLQPTGEQVKWTWVFVLRFEDGKIAEERWVWDWPLADGE